MHQLDRFALRTFTLLYPTTHAKNKTTSSPFGHVCEGPAVQLPDLGEDYPAGKGHLRELLQAKIDVELVALLLEREQRHLGVGETDVCWKMDMERKH